MNRSIITKLAMGILMVLLVCGCQIIGGGPSDEELISATINDWKAAHDTQDIDKIMATFSENYVSMRGDGKDSMREFLPGPSKRALWMRSKLKSRVPKSRLKATRLRLVLSNLSPTGVRSSSITYSRRKTAPGSL